MADPLFTPAIVGTFVSMFFTEVIDAAKSAYRFRAKCKIVLDSVDKLQPNIDIAKRNSAHWDEAESRWLKEIESLVVDARTCATRGRDETKEEKLKRAMVFWRWGKLPTTLMDIVGRIEEAQRNVVFVAALATLSHLNAPKMKKSLEFIPQQLPSHIVGVDDKFHKLKASILASRASEKPNYFGLHGRGGAGKTLLAQLLHNDKDIKEAYGDSVLWITVGLEAKVEDMYKTMALFLGSAEFEDMYGRQSLKEQRRYLWHRFAEKQALLILDDVWQENHKENHEMMYWLNIATARGSATLITTRNTSILSEADAEGEVVLGLSEEDSWKLFCSHAFHNVDRLPTIAEKLAKDVCNECKGLPLALKVIGCAMKGKVDEREWSSTLVSMKQSKPAVGSRVDAELYGCLRLSYDYLSDDVLKTCFLYVAAFPEDYKIPTSTLFDAWIAEELFGVVGSEDVESMAWKHLKVLEERSLVDWNHDEEYVQVHDMLRDLALHLIDKALPGEVAHECFFHAGRELKSFPVSESLQARKRMSFVGSTILEWPEKLEAPNLEVGLFSKMIIPEEASLESFLSDLTNLKYLDLSGNGLKIEAYLPSFEGLNSLLHLKLGGNYSLKMLPKSIGKLKCLTSLDLSRCGDLRELPQSIGELKCLTSVNLSSCRSLQELPQSIGELKCLTNLNLSVCGAFEELPQSIGELKCLTSLDLFSCGYLKELPQSICELKCLTNFNLSRCGFLKELPQSIGKLKSLTSLDLSFCGALKELPQSIGELKCLTYLNLSYCESLKELPQCIGELKCLTSLDLSYCESLKELPQNIGELKCLTNLCLVYCWSLKELPQIIGELKCLTDLNLSRSRFLKELPQCIGELKCLTKLSLSKCGSLKELPESIGKLKSLTNINLSICGSLKELPQSIGELKCLTNLNLSYCGSLKELPHSIGELKCLTDLNLTSCGSLKELPQSIGELKYLRKLSLSKCGSLKELPESIGELKSLTDLDLSFCESLKEIPQSIGELKCLRLESI